MEFFISSAGRISLLHRIYIATVKMCICTAFSRRRWEDKRVWKGAGQQDDRDLVASSAASAAAPTYPVARGVRNYRSNECVQRKYAPMATRVLCALCSFPFAVKRVRPPISVFVLRICTRELPARAIARGKIARPLVRFNEKFALLQMKRAMILLGNYSPDPRATFSGNSRV